MTKCKQRLRLTIRTLLLAFFAGSGFLIVWSFALDASLSSALSLASVALGLFTGVVGALGFCGARCCLKTYLLLAAAVLLPQAAGLLFAFLSLEPMVEGTTRDDEEEDRAMEVLRVARWPLAVVFCLEGVAFVLSAGILCCYEDDLDFEPFEETAPNRRPDLTKLRSSIGRTAFDVETSASTKRLQQRMAQKYGHLSHTTQWSVERKWWPFGQRGRT